MKKYKSSKKPMVMRITKQESKIIDNIDKLEFSMSIKPSARNIKIPTSTFYDAWNRILSQHKVEFVLLIDGYEFSRKVPFKYRRRKCVRRKW